MNLTVDEITKSITGKPSLYECGTDELKLMASQYPFFGPAKFLLAKKLKQDNSPLVEEHIQKASLYFQNPVWFDHVLNETGVIDNYIPAAKEKPEVPLSKQEPPVTHEDVVVQSPAQREMNDLPDEDEAPADPDISDHTHPLQLPKFNFESIDTSKAELTFEPYHTIDYFASQGIQAKEDEKPQDQFGRQLKSFTEWLKTLKRANVSEIVATVSPVEEEKVEKLAEVSINDREVVTETMAEVWEKQGNVVKATEVYRKLSLLNPSKSSYFAAKIDQLKHL